jgi:hypothetical protein
MGFQHGGDGGVGRGTVKRKIGVAAALQSGLPRSGPVVVGRGVVFRIVCFGFGNLALHPTDDHGGALVCGHGDVLTL